MLNPFALLSRSGIRFQLQLNCKNNLTTQSVPEMMSRTSSALVSWIRAWHWTIFESKSLMFAVRRLLAALLICSLLVSDAVTYWHLGSCECAASSENLATLGQQHLSCERGCADHVGNPFARRKAVAEETKPAPEPPSHDEDSCSVCRWLVTARDPVAVSFTPVVVELAVSQTPVNRDWASPTPERMLQDLTRRGPPAASSLS
jgi:hypothetical protein